MNTVSVEKHAIYDVDTLMLCIDGTLLNSHVTKISGNEYSDLYLAWLPLYDEIDEAYIHTLLELEQSSNLPILLCPDDLDLGCTVIVAKIRYDDKYVYWDNIGLLDWLKAPNELFQNRRLNALSHWSDSYELARLDLCEDIWSTWCSKCKSESDSYYIWNNLHPFLNNDTNINWFDHSPLIFDKSIYLSCIKQILIT